MLTPTLLRSLRRARAFVPAMIACLLLAATGADAATLRVETTGSDSAACTSAAPCRSFNRAYQVASPGDVVQVGSGTYQDQEFMPKNAGAPDVTVQPAPGATVTVKELAVTGATRLTVKGMRIEPVSGRGSTDQVLDIGSSDYVTFDHITVDVMGQVRDGVGINGNVDHLTVRDSDIGNNRDAKLIISQNYNNAGYNDFVTFDRVAIHDNVQSSTSVHLECWLAMSLKDFTLRNSHFYRCALNMNSGIFGGELAPVNWRIQNNVFEKGQGATGPAYLDIDGCPPRTNWVVEYNQFSQGIAPCNSETQTVWRGNIGANTGCGVFGTYAYNTWSNRTPCGVTDRQLATILAPANFVNAAAGDFRASSASAPQVDAGDPSIYPSTDAAGAARPAGAGPDAGPFEFGGGTAPADTTPPDTTITSGPSGSTTSTSSSLAFSATESATFACRIDGGSWASCTSPKSYSGLAVGSHTFEVRATDTAGNTDPSPASSTWTVTAPADTTPPNTTITSAPSGSTTATSASLAFSATEAVTFECRMDGGSWTACTSPKAYSGLALGAHTFDVRATDLAGNVDLTPASAAWNVVAGADTTPPDTSIVSGPSGSTTSTSASLAFSATESATFECRMDGGSWTACTSPKAYSGLALGTHTFDVRATDAAGNTDLSPASRAWTVTAPADTTAPDTSITSGPSGSGTDTSAALAFTASEAGSTFECRLDGGTWAACTSPKSYSAMAVGTHTFDVRATDAAGNTDASPASRSWTVVAPADTTPPDTTITSGPPASTTATTASVSFTATEAGSTFQCRLDSGAWAACASPEGDSGLTVGAHKIDVRATDAAGNVDATPASWSWTVVAPAPPPPAPDTTAPDTNLTSGPTTVTTQRSATFEFTATETPATFACSLDSSRWYACTSPKSYSSLSRGKHTIRVRATDAAGNTDATPVTYSWSIVRRTYGTTYSFEPLSGRSSTPVQADSLEGACALVSNSRARLGVRLRGLNIRRSHGAIRISGKVPELAQDGVNARVRVSVRSHGHWRLLVSRRVHVRFDGSFRVKAPRRSGKLKVTAIARCG